MHTVDTRYFIYGKQKEKLINETCHNRLRYFICIRELLKLKDLA